MSQPARKNGDDGQVILSAGEHNGGHNGALAMPHNMEAEQSLIGALLINNLFYEQISDFLQPEHFYNPLHRRIYETIKQLLDRGEIVTLHTLRPFFEGDEDFVRQGGMAYLTNLAAHADAIMVEANARAIKTQSIRRELLQVAQEIHEKARMLSPDNPPEQQIEQAEQKLYDIAERGRIGGGFQSFASALAEVEENAEAARLSEKHTSGLTTGFIDLDARLGGLQKSDLVIIAARPAMGKTSLATGIAVDLARRWRGEEDDSSRIKKTVEGAKVGFFSLEMARSQLVMRTIAEHAKIDSRKIREGRLTEEEIERFGSANEDLRAIPLHIDDTGAISIASIAARARRMKRKQGLDLLIVDYLQLITAGGSRRVENRVQEVSAISQGLKALAKELDIPVIALSQLSRQPETREGRRKVPQLSDLRESGSIEQDADIVMFIYREEYYLEKEKPEENTPEFVKWQAKMEAAAGRADIIIGKHRHGPTGQVSMHFDHRYTRFSDLVIGDYPDEGGVP